MARRWIAAAAAAATVALTPGTALALPLLQWTLEMSPSTVPEDQSTTFTLTATNALLSVRPLGCLEVDLPPSFVIEAVGTPVASNGQSWSSTVAGQAVVVHSDTSGGSLGLLASVTFTIQARPTAPGSFTWPNHAHVTIDCSGADQAGTPLDVTVTPAPTPTPSPSPSPSPSPTPKPSPSPTPSLPLPTLPLPTLPLPTDPPPSLPLPTLPPTPVAKPTPVATPSPSPSPTPSQAGESTTPEPTPAPGAVGPPRSGPPPDQPPGTGNDPVGVIQLVPESARGFDGLGVGLGIGDLLADVHVWSVPAVAIGVPGLLLIAWVALQAGGVLVWVPAVRRMRGDDRNRRRPRRR
jgi:hypothetical protein